MVAKESVLNTLCASKFVEKDSGRSNAAMHRLIGKLF